MLIKSFLKASDGVSMLAQVKWMYLGMLVLSFDAEAVLWTSLGSDKKGWQSEIKMVFRLQDLLPKPWISLILCSLCHRWSHLCILFLLLLAFNHSKTEFAGFTWASILFDIWPQSDKALLTQIFPLPGNTDAMGNAVGDIHMVKQERFFFTFSQLERVPTEDLCHHFQSSHSIGNVWWENWSGTLFLLQMWEGFLSGTYH